MSFQKRTILLQGRTKQRFFFFTKECPSWLTTCICKKWVTQGKSKTVSTSLILMINPLRRVWTCQRSNKCNLLNLCACVCLGGTKLYVYQSTTNQPCKGVRQQLAHSFPRPGRLICQAEEEVKQQSSRLQTAVAGAMKRVCWGAEGLALLR